MKADYGTPMRRMALAGALVVATLGLSGCHGLHVAASVHDAYGHGHHHGHPGREHAHGHGHRGGHAHGPGHGRGHHGGRRGGGGRHR